MSKLSQKIINRVNELDSKEIDHIINTVRYADKKGFVKNGTYYKDTALETQMSERHTYNCIKSLSEKGIYQVDGTGNILIPDNSLEVCMESGYINIPEFVFTRNFLKASVLIKRLALKLLSMRVSSQVFNIGDKKLMEWLELNRFSKLDKIMDQLNKWFDIGTKIDGCKSIIYSIKLKVECMATKIRDNRRAEKEIKDIFRKDRVPHTLKDIKDFAQLLNQYKNKFYIALDEVKDKFKKGMIDGAILRNKLKSLPST
jgi:hypothetical protein